MRPYLIIFGIVISTFLMNANAYAGNPGRDATRCISASTNSNDVDNVIFKNNCGEFIFVVWCGEQRWTKKRCGDGRKGELYYTHSGNIAPYGEKTATIVKGGRFNYASCMGKIGFGSEGIKHPARDNGNFRCTPTGSNR